MRFDLSSPETLADPGPVLAAMRAAGPVVRLRLPIFGTVWAATTDAAVRRMLKDDACFVRDSAHAGGRSMARTHWWAPPFMRVLLGNPAQLDGEDHDRLRRAAAGAFARRDIDALRPALAAIADGLIDRLPRDRPVDLIAGFAAPLPMAAICEVLGVADADRARIARQIAPMARAHDALSLARAVPGLWRVTRHFRRDFTVVARDNRPGLIRELVAGGGLTGDETLALVVALFVAGHETSLQLLGLGAQLLAGDAGLRARLLADPALWPAVVEEVMRLQSPVMFTNIHYVARDCDLDGVALRRGERIVPLLAAANRDPARYGDPDRFDPDRRRNAHLGFGFGPHVCLGMQLARAEAHVGLERLLSRCPELRLADEAPRWTRRLGLRGLSRLAVRLGPA